VPVRCQRNRIRRPTGRLVLACLSFQCIELALKFGVALSQDRVLVLEGLHSRVSGRIHQLHRGHSESSRYLFVRVRWKEPKGTSSALRALYHSVQGLLQRTKSNFECENGCTTALPGLGTYRQDRQVVLYNGVVWSLALSSLTMLTLSIDRSPGLCDLRCALAERSPGPATEWLCLRVRVHLSSIKAPSHP